MITHSGIGDLSTSVASRNLGDASRTAVARIGSSPSDEFVNPTFAAGAVMWRRLSPADPGTPETGAEDAVEIAVIHRPRYDDWSLPKGKVDKGEGIVQTAVRELVEETGYASTLGWLLGYVHYPVGNSTKVVWYWTAEVTDYSDPPRKTPTRSASCAGSPPPRPPDCAPMTRTVRSSPPRWSACPSG
ncbi:NUDIX hydrolase [Corynebacterium variabile]|uniref:NUDIX hydrolase n=1 Tax=Corynebacterium variabile TaxID=1727 RepID=UPI003CB9977D